jgi:hypothetical protein
MRTHRKRSLPKILALALAAASSGVAEVPDADNTASSAQPTEGWITVDIPQVDGSVMIPTDWNRPTSDQALAGIEYLKLNSDEERAEQEMGSLAIGRKRVWITRDPEPSPNFNPSFDIAWEEAPATMGKIPAEARGPTLAQAMASNILPALKEKSIGFVLLEGPKPMKDGAWATFKVGTELKDGRTVESLVRFNIFLSGDKLVMVTLALPVDKDEAEKVTPVLWEIFKSLKLGNITIGQ